MMLANRNLQNFVRPSKRISLNQNHTAVDSKQLRSRESKLPVPKPCVGSLVASLTSDHNKLSSARRSLADVENAHAQLTVERNTIEQTLSRAQEKIHELEARIEDESRDSSDGQLLRQRLNEEMDDERKQHQKDLAERDFTADQTRKKYQGGSVMRTI